MELLRRLDDWGNAHEQGHDPGPLIRWAAAHIRGCQSLSGERKAVVARLVRRHTHDGANVLVYGLRNNEDGCRLCRALVADGVLTLDEIGADTRARLSLPTEGGDE